ncbi:hypothetical protein GCM10023222_09700 [Saccharopolyspora cebuensis]
MPSAAANTAEGTSGWPSITTTCGSPPPTETTVHVLDVPKSIETCSDTQNSFTVGAIRDVREAGPPRAPAPRAP